MSHDDDVPTYWRSRHYWGARLFHEQLEACAKSEAELAELLEAVDVDHREYHLGPIRYCNSLACRWLARHVAA